DAQRDPELLGVDALEVRPGAERTPLAGDHDDPGAVAGDAVDRLVEQPAVLGVEGVAPVRSIDGDERDPVAPLGADHVDSSSAVWIRDGVSGSVFVSTPHGESASATALARVAATPSVDPSPTPRAPVTVAAGSSTWPTSNA